jgi:hypothetical protein
MVVDYKKFRENSQAGVLTVLEQMPGEEIIISLESKFKNLTFYYITIIGTPGGVSFRWTYILLLIVE